ncbi:3-hydroxybutyrate dehydrogenase [Chitinimonas sp. PSY-7]|uniref:3-hydroxybutyrate dehydrogenase n=1 Tax=Chitinimonas sp. PSY-7 TaxID=3459088 RepID=UPI00403FFB83
MYTLQGKTALITGSTSGIGLGIAIELAREGVNIVLNGFGNAQAASDLIASFDVAVAYHPADMSKPSEIADMMAFASQTVGPVDILVNNAGIQHVASIEDFPPERWDAVIAINLSSSFHTCRLAIPTMRERGWGRIINLASVHGLVASKQKSAYVAAKHGLIGLTKAVALELAQTPITCNAICPGWVLTPLVEAQIEARAGAGGISVEEAGHELLAEKQPSQEFVTVAQVGKLAAFLCSDAAEQIRGAAWNMDGGWVAQ